MEKNFLQNFSLEGKVALVTGASYGIGFGIATAFAQCGATIVFNDIKQELVDKGLAAYKEKGIEAHGYVCDVTDETAVNALVARIEKEVGVIDILVNNAGIIKNTTSNVTVSVRVTSLLLKPLRCVNVNRTAAAILSTVSSWPRLLLPVGVLLKTCKVRPCSWLRTLPTSSTVWYCM